MERGAGNPLFLRELASVGEKAHEAEELPETVEALVATRIDQLAPGDRALLRWASVLGVSFSGSLIADVLEERPARRGRLRGMGPARRVRRARSGRPRCVPLPSRAHPRRGVRGALVQATARTARARRRGHRAEPRRPTRGGGRAAVAALLQRGSLGRGVDVLAPRRATCAGGLCERRRRALLRARARRERAARRPWTIGELASTWRSLGEVRDAAGDYRGAIEALKAATAAPEGRSGRRGRDLRGASPRVDASRRVSALRSATRRPESTESSPWRSRTRSEP